MANSEGSEAMLNRVMTKDNIGVAVLLELRKEIMEQSGLFSFSPFFLLLVDVTPSGVTSDQICMINWKYTGMWFFLFIFFIFFSYKYEFLYVPTSEGRPMWFA